MCGPGRAYRLQGTGFAVCIDYGGQTHTFADPGVWACGGVPPSNECPCGSPTGVSPRHTGAIGYEGSTPA